jgi:nicotinate dehydrogenase subunit B
MSLSPHRRPVVGDRPPQAAPGATLTREALAALRDAGFSRRRFLQGAGALVVSFSMRGFMPRAAAQFEGGEVGPSHDLLDSWIAIGADGSVTAYTGKEEIGQGISTAQIQLVAEELCVPFERVNLIYCDTSMTPDQGVTSGSQSHPTNFNHSNLAQAGATARQALLQMASKRLEVPVERLAAADGAVSVKDDPSKKVSYGDLIGGKKFSIRLDGKAPRKPPSEWTVLGKPAQRPDLPGLVTGKFEFVHNMRLPGMLFGRVVRPPAVGAAVAHVDESSVASMPGVVKVVVKKNFVGVVAQKPWQAVQAAEKLSVAWTPGKGLPKQADFYDYVRNSKPVRDTLLVNSGNVDQALAGAPTLAKATYYHPYQMHGSMGSSCAVADVQGDQATIYSPTQAVWHQQATSAMVLGLKPENVRVVFRRGSGCYGCNGADTVTYDAALLSQAVGKPVKVQLSRKDEMAWGENYGFAFVMDERAGLDAQGNIVAWDHESWSPVFGNRPGMTTPGNVVTGMLAGFEPEPFNARSPAPEPRAYNNGSNGVPSYFAGNVGGSAKGTGTIQAERSLAHNTPSPFFTGPLRSPARLQNTFAHECFMDELAARCKADPVAFRLKHLSDSRLIDVVKAAAETAHWDARPSPKAPARRTGVVTGRGVACVAYEGDNGFAAMVAEIEVNQDTGKISVKRIVVSNDSGPISNPDGLRNQIEGGALQGLSRALGEEVTWDDQKVTSVDWRTYHSLPLGFDVPKIEVTLLNRPDENATGAGETSITLTAAAVGNAIFDATGARIRQVPFTPERVKAALGQPSSRL